MEYGESIDLSDINKWSLSESKIYIAGSSCSTDLIRNENDFEQAIQFISYYKRAHIDSLIRNGSMNYMQIGGSNYDDYYNMVTSNYSALKYKPNMNSNTIYKITLTVPDLVLDEIVLKPGLKAVFHGILSSTLLNVCINIFSDVFMTKAIETLGEISLKKSIENGEALVTNVINYTNNAKSSFSLYCNQATIQNPKFGYKAIVRKTDMFKNVFYNNSRTIVIDIDAYYKINNKIK